MDLSKVAVLTVLLSVVIQLLRNYAIIFVKRGLLSCKEVRKCNIDEFNYLKPFNYICEATTKDYGIK